MKFKSLHLNVAGLLLPILLAACSGPDAPRLQPVPELILDDLSDAVGDQIRVGIAEVLANEKDPEANGHLGMLFDAYSRVKDAEVFYSRARFLAPDRFKWTYLHGMALAQLGNNEAAIAALEKALDQRRGYPGAQLALAGLVYSAHDIDRAIQLYSQLIERNPAFARAYYEYGKLLFEQAATESAIASLRSALWLSNRYGQAHYTLSQAYRKLDDQEKAAVHLALFERYRRFAPGTNDPLKDQIAALNISNFNQEERALKLSAMGDQQAAAAQLEQLAGMSGSASAHINLIAVYGELGEFDKAQAHADIALAIDPDSVELYNNIGIMRLRQRQFVEAEQAFRKAMTIDPDYSVPYRNLGAVLEAVGRRDEAVASFRQSVAIDPYDRQARYFLARSLLAENQPAEAIAVIAEMAAHSFPETPFYLQLLGQAYQGVGDYQSAADAFRRAAAAAQSQGNMGLASEAAAQLQRALRMLQP